MMKNLVSIFLTSLILMNCTSDSKNDLFNSNDFNGIHSIIDVVESESVEHIDFTSNKAGDIAIPDSYEPSKPQLFTKNVSKIIKRGTLTFEVNSMEISKSRIDKLIKKFDGYYEDENYNKQTWQKRVSLIIRVPNQYFDTLINLFENGEDELISKSINAKDVSEEYTDLNIRLQNKLAYLKQYQEILKKANTIEEILNVKNKIRELEEEIESKKGRILFLDDKVKYSTLNLDLIQLTESKVKRNSFIKRMTNALSGGYHGFLSFIVFMVYQWPLWIFLMIFWIFRKKVRKIFNWRKK